MITSSGSTVSSPIATTFSAPPLCLSCCYVHCPSCGCQYMTHIDISRLPKCWSKECQGCKTVFVVRCKEEEECKECQYKVTCLGFPHSKLKVKKTYEGVDSIKWDDNYSPTTR